METVGVLSLTEGGGKNAVSRNGTLHAVEARMLLK